MSEKDKESIDKIFPKSKELRKEFDAVHTPMSTLPIPDGRKNRSLNLKKNQTTSKQGKKEVEAKIPKEVVDVMDKNKDELWDIILDENIEPEEFDKKLNTLVRKMPKTTSALKGVRELYEDKLQIDELRDIISDSREKRTGKTSKVSVDEEAEETSDLMTMMPLLKKLKGQGGGQGGKMGMEDMLWLMMSRPSKQSSSLLPIIMMMMQQNQQGSNDDKAPQQRPANVEFNQLLLNEIKDIVGQQQQQSPAIDPNTMLLMKFMDNQKQDQQPNFDRILIEKLLANKQNQQPSLDRIIIEKLVTNNNNQNQQQPGIELILDKFNTIINSNQNQQFQMMMQQSQDKWDRSMEMIAGALQGKNPKKDLLEDFKIFKSIQGENRHRGKDEMEYDFKSKTLDLEEKKRIDKIRREDRRRIEMMNREERKDIREDNKSEKIMDLATDFIAPIMQDGLGGVINDIMGAKTGKGRRKKRKIEHSEDEQEFSASDIDEL